MASRGGTASNFLTKKNGPTKRLLKTIHGVNTDTDQSTMNAPTRLTSQPSANNKLRSSTDESKDSQQLAKRSSSRTGVVKSARTNTNTASASTSKSRSQSPTKQERTTRKRLIRKSAIIAQKEKDLVASTAKKPTLADERIAREEFLRQSEKPVKETKGTIRKRAFEELRARREAKQNAAGGLQKPNSSDTSRDSTPEASKKRGRAPLEDLESQRRGINKKLKLTGDGMKDKDVTEQKGTAEILDESSAAHRAHELKDEHGFIIGSSVDQLRFKKSKTYGSRPYSKLPVKNDDNKGFQNPLDKLKHDALEKVKRLAASDKFKDPTKKVAAALAACAPTKEESIGFKRPRQLPSDSSQEVKEPEFKKPRLISSSSPSSAFVKADIALSNTEGSMSGFKKPPHLPVEAGKSYEATDSAEKSTTRRSLRSKAAVVEVPTSGNAVDITKIAGEILKSGCKSKDLQEVLQATLESAKPSDSSAVSFAAVVSVNSTDSSPLSSPPRSPPALSSQESKADGGRKPHERLAPSTNRCPLCRELVDPAFLKTFGNGKHMNMRNQSKFCRAHKQKTAEVEWVTRGYPEIEWDGLPARIQKLNSHLEDLLDGKVESHYRNNLEANFRSGKNRTLASSIMSADFQTLTPGYYGSKGARVIFETIMSGYSTRIHDLAITDKLISSGGAASYIQVVLVPELALRLIQEDMKLDTIAAARQVLVDSTEIGNLLHEDNQA